MFAGHTIGSIAVTAVLAIGTPPGEGDFPSGFSAEERCVITAALRSGDPRRVRIAGEVLRREAGVLALAEPWLVHHHRLNIADRCPSG